MSFYETLAKFTKLYLLVNSIYWLGENCKEESFHCHSPTSTQYDMVAHVYMGSIDHNWREQNSPLYLKNGI